MSRDIFRLLPAACGWAVATAGAALFDALGTTGGLLPSLAPVPFIVVGSVGFGLGGFVTARHRPHERGIPPEAVAWVTAFVLTSLMFFSPASWWPIPYKPSPEGMSIPPGFDPTQELRIASHVLSLESIRLITCASLFGLISGLLSPARVNVVRRFVIAIGWALAVLLVSRFWFMGYYVGVVLGMEVGVRVLSIPVAVGLFGALAGFASGSIGEAIQRWSSGTLPEKKRWLALQLALAVGIAFLPLRSLLRLIFL